MFEYQKWACIFHLKCDLKVVAKLSIKNQIVIWFLTIKT
jgi:hypothetical protein